MMAGKLEVSFKLHPFRALWKYYKYEAIVLKTIKRILRDADEKISFMSHVDDDGNEGDVDDVLRHQ